MSGAEVVRMKLDHRKSSRCSIAGRWGTGLIMALATLLLGNPVPLATAEDEAQVQESARLIAVLLDSGRVAIGRNQDPVSYTHLTLPTSDLV